MARRNIGLALLLGAELAGCRPVGTTWSTTQTPRPPVSPVGTPGSPAPSPPAAGRFPNWPTPNTPQPVVLAMGESATNLDDVANRIRHAEPNPFLRVKALHDFVTLWVRDDGQAVFPDDHPPAQDAESVFRRRTATCEGYVALMQALGARTGDTFTRVAGLSRPQRARADAGGHAWRAATIAGQHDLLDPTWDAGSVFGTEFKPRDATAYLVHAARACRQRSPALRGVLVPPLPAAHEADLRGAAHVDGVALRVGHVGRGLVRRGDASRRRHELPHPESSGRCARLRP